jgi:hypothetical protein
MTKKLSERKKKTHTLVRRTHHHKRPHMSKLLNGACAKAEAIATKYTTKF